MTWDQFFVLMAQTAARKSKDPSTKVGAVIVDDDNIIRATGFNGFPREVDDDPEKYADRETKYKYVIHAEENALLAAARVGVQLKGCRLYCSMHPCFQCAKRIIQCGITEVYYPYPDSQDDAYRRWAKDMAEARDLVLASGIMIYAIDMPYKLLEQSMKSALGMHATLP